MYKTKIKLALQKKLKKKLSAYYWIVENPSQQIVRM
jgi:hypothetical protein